MSRPEGLPLWVKDRRRCILCRIAQQDKTNISTSTLQRWVAMFSGKKLARFWPKRSSTGTANHQEASSRSAEINNDAAVMRSRPETEQGRRKQVKDSKSRARNQQQELELELERYRQDYIKLEETVHSLMPYRNQAEVLEKRLSQLYQSIDRERSEHEAMVDTLTAENEQLRQQLTTLQSDRANCTYCCRQNHHSLPSALPLQDQTAEVTVPVQQQHASPAVCPAVSQDGKDLADLSNVVLSSAHTLDANHVLGNAVPATRPDSTDALRVAVSGPTKEAEIRGSVPTVALYAPVTHTAASGEVAYTSSHGHGDEFLAQEVARVNDEETPVSALQDFENEAESEKISWLLGDDGLKSPTPTDFLLEDGVTHDRRLGVQSAAVHSGNRHDVIRVRDDDQTVEELVGARSPLANLPTETDIDALIELLRASPSSSKPISHTSTISINDILDEEPDIEVAVELETSLCGLVDGYSADDADKDLRNAAVDAQTPGKFHAEFRNNDRQGFGFGFQEFDDDRIVEDVAKQLIASKSGTRSSDKDKKDHTDTDVTVEGAAADSKGLSEISLDSSTAENNLLKDGFALDSEQDKNLNDRVSQSDDNLADISRLSTDSEVDLPSPYSEVVEKKEDGVENPSSIPVVDGLALYSDVPGAEDGYKNDLSDFICGHVKQKDGSLEVGTILTNSTGSGEQNEPDEQNALGDHKFRKCETASAVRKLSDTGMRQPRLSKETADSKVRPGVRRKSCEWNISAEVRKSADEVGKDNVTALTAYFEEVHADQCQGCTVCLTGAVERPFVIKRRSSLPTGTGSGLTLSGELTADDGRRTKPTARPTIESANNKESTKSFPAPEPKSDAGLAQLSNSLPRRFVPTSKSSLQESKLDTTSGFRNSLSSVTETGGIRDTIHQTISELTATPSRRVVSLPDMSGGSGSTAKSRDGKTRAEFRFRLARVRSHSLRSFNDLTTSVISKRSTASRPVKPVANQQSYQHPGSSAAREDPKHNVYSVDGLNFARKSTVSKYGQSSPESSGQRVKTFDKMVGTEDQKRTQASVSLDNLLAEICSPTTKEKENDSLTPDMILKYTIEPRRRRPVPAPPPRHGSRPAVNSRQRDPRVAARPKRGGLEQRIDAMLTGVDRQWSEDEWYRPVRRHVPRTTTTSAVHPSAVDFNYTYTAQPTAQWSHDRSHHLTVKPPRHPLKHSRSADTQDGQVYDNTQPTFSFPVTQVPLSQNSDDAWWLASRHPEASERSQQSFQRWISARRQRSVGTPNSKQSVPSRRVPQPAYPSADERLSLQGDLAVCIGLTVQCSPVEAVHTSAPSYVSNNRRQLTPRCGAAAVDAAGVVPWRNPPSTRLVPVRSSDDVPDYHQFRWRGNDHTGSFWHPADVPKFRHTRRGQEIQAYGHAKAGLWVDPQINIDELTQRGSQPALGRDTQMPHSYGNPYTTDWPGQTRGRPHFEDFAVGFENESSSSVPEDLSRGIPGQAGVMDEEDTAFDEITQQIATLTQTVNELRFKHRRSGITQNQGSAYTYIYSSDGDC